MLLEQLQDAAHVVQMAVEELRLSLEGEEHDKAKVGWAPALRPRAAAMRLGVRLPQLSARPHSST
jgi:hypothetical protein